MSRPEKELTQRDFQRNAHTTRRLLAYLLRAAKLRIDPAVVGRDRWLNFARELSEALGPLVVSERSTLGFFRALCTRFDVDPSSGQWGPVEIWLPEGRLRWDHAVAAMAYADVRLVIHESPDFLSTFACCRPVEGEDELFQQFPAPAAGGSYRPTLPAQTIKPAAHQTTWLLVSPMHHGADEKHGNVNLFRRQRMHDPLTGTTSYVPFISGNAVRGVWRDLAMFRWLQLIGVNARDIPVHRAHSLLAGGTVEAGADGSKVNNETRDRARDLCPPWDLFAGCIDQQIMGGRVNIGDAVLVCRETAWLVHDQVAPQVPLADFAASLPVAAEMTQLRLGTRHAHKDVPESEGIQMLWNTEVLIAGFQMTHSFQLKALEGARLTTASCLSDLLGAFHQHAQLGAGNSRGLGQLRFAPYVPSQGASALPSPDLYLEYVEIRKQAMLDWVMSERPPAEPKPKKVKPVKGDKVNEVA